MTAVVIESAVFPWRQNNALLGVVNVASVLVAAAGNRIGINVMTSTDCVTIARDPFKIGSFEGGVLATEERHPIGLHELAST